MKKTSSPPNLNERCYNEEDFCESLDVDVTDFQEDDVHTRPTKEFPVLEIFNRKTAEYAIVPAKNLKKVSEGSDET